MAAIAVAIPDEHLRISLNFAGTSTPEMWMFQWWSDMYLVRKKKPENYVRLTSL